MPKYYQEIKTDGSLELGTPFTSFDPKPVFDKALSEFYELEFSSARISNQLYEYKLTYGNTSSLCKIYLFTVEGPGRGGVNSLGGDISEASGEKRIQWKKSIPFSGIKEYNKALKSGELLNKECYVIGVYQRPNDRINSFFVGFHPDNINTNPTSFPYSKQLKIKHIQQAHEDGFSQQKKTNEEYVFIFKPQYLISYMANRDQIHKKVLDGVLKPSGAIVPPSEYPHNLIYFGAPGTGKSNAIDSYTSGKNSIKVTFHPDTDYSSFVGSYKPTQLPDGPGITYGYVAQAFLKAYTKAWETEEDTFLIIEEINRGNCAQIFGDIFQIIERGEDGYSRYKINTDSEIRRYLKNHFETLMASSSEDARKAERYFSYFEGSFEKIALPNNLFIHATMNTSDQSLFPIDSAFKRRWDWEYVPITFENREAENYQIRIGDESYSWKNFVKAVNDKIQANTESEDKKIGPFFIKTFDNSISEKRFKAKVLFFIWNDILKDEPPSDPSYFFRHTTDGDNSSTETFTFSDLFSENGTQIIKGFMKYLGITRTPV